ncbi:cytochrome-c peroxidase [Maribacter luteus]|uniref:Methylamine utilization protein n=1 Tax=Maribacter luteus TaxID=2594478 RepID=A0A6I2MM72_9FLAO|nr:cytochrome c peroxidase [Maribacter luteus]MRX63907.1 methylamine utilization protein [Maribacter luteus]
MKFLNLVLVLSSFLLLLFSCKNEPIKSITTDKDSLFNEDIKQYYFKVLDSASFYMAKIDTISSLSDNKAYFLKSREWYKRAEPIMIAYDYENYLSMNAPNLLKVEMEDFTDIKKQKPKSYQVIEELLFAEEKPLNNELQSVLDYLKARIPYMRKNHIIYKQRDRHHLKMLRDAIVNIATKGITGFDSPILANSLKEAVYNYETISTVIGMYKNTFKDNNLYESWSKEIASSIKMLKDGDFDTFDRYTFIKDHTNKQLQLVNSTAKDWGVQLNTSRALDPTATNVFSKTFFNKKMFALQGSPPISEERIALGKQLFNDPSFSSTGTMSCATCHIKEKAFTDGKPKGIGKNGAELQRNTPTLPYAVYQRTFFYDGRGDGLEGQIVGVVNNENEFHLDLNTMDDKIKGNPKYIEQFNALYGGKINNLNVRNAIATYIRSLTPFDSKFDRNMQNLENTLTTEEIEGFNLFMGKAACATCHFPPAFYGTVPPKYDETEFENLGVTQNTDFAHPVLDNDPGLYYPYEVDEKRNFFKTSTVRNIDKTAPYMHNGAFETLEDVLEFYNAGGGQGLGLDVPYQTLPPDSLLLSDNETKAIIAFMKTLTDKDYE